MKNIILIILLSLTGNSFSQVPDYFGNNPSWNLQRRCYISVDMLNTYDVKLEIEDTVTLGGFEYFSIGGNTGYFCSEDALFLRQVGRSLRYFESISQTDSLLISYDYQIGDYAKGNLFKHQIYDSLEIEKIDSVLVGSEYRREFYLDTLGSNWILIEGIGYLQTALGLNKGYFHLDLAYPAYLNIRLNCFAQNDTVVWYPDGFFGGCIGNGQTLSEADQQALQVAIYPNPASDLLSVSGITKGIEDYQIYDMNGSLIKDAKFYGQIDISILKAGIYVIQFGSTGSDVIRKQFVKN
ncbi:MAG: hypothetical protein ACI857_001189 [Arenicella sp.]|jgi:hypothetical protein